MFLYVLIAYLILFTYLLIPLILFIFFMKFKFNLFLSIIFISLLILPNHGALKLRFSKAIMNKHNNLIENISNKSEN